jgi:hypothetical protein
MGAWAYYQEPSYYETVVTGLCLACDEDINDVPAKVQEHSTTAYWKCPKCNTYNDTEIE